MQPTTDSPGAHWRALLTLNLLALLGLLAYLGWQMRPVAMHDLHLEDGERLQCVSYAPFRLPGQTPFDADLRISRAQIAADLAELARISACVRTYSVDQGLEQVPEVAREHGLKVLLGAWIGADAARNAAQLDTAIALANAHPDVVDVLIVGNEVLLRRERTAAEMRALLDDARTRAQVPVTYADVWEFWLQNRELAAAVDRVTVHILPFWEDHPVGIDDAVDHVGSVLAEVRAAFDKPVMIGETGWPSAGRQRQAARPAQVNQARFIREFVHRAHLEGWHYNLIEAIDQPWKRRLEGTVGGHWGMLSAQLEAKFPLAGTVAERNGVLAPAFAAVVGALLCLVLARMSHTVPTAGADTLAVARRTRSRRLDVVSATPSAPLAPCGAPRRRLGPLVTCLCETCGLATGGATRRLAAASGGAAGGMIVVLHGEHALQAYRSGLEWAVLGTVALLGALLPVTLARWSGTGRAPAFATLWSATQHPATAALRAFSVLRAALLFAAAVAALLLAFDPRYRDFPLWLYALPALYAGIAAWWLADNGREERICAAVIAAAALLRWSTEPLNPQACAWLLCALALAAPALRRRGA